MIGSVKRDPNGRTWGYVFDAPPGGDGRRRQKRKRGFATRRDAERAMRSHLAEVANEPQATTSETLLGFFVGYVQRLDGRAPSTLLAYRHLVDGHVRSHPLAATALGEVRTVDVEALLEAARARPGRGGRQLSSKTLRNLFNFLRSGFDDAVRTGRIATNPMAGLTPPQVRRDPDATRFWTADEARAFLGWIDGSLDPNAPPIASVVALALLTGMRRGELLGLRWEDLDEGRRTLMIRRTRVGVGTRVVEGPPKTDRGRRTLSLAGPHLAVFRVVRQRQEIDQVRFGDRWADTGFVFTDDHGRGLNPDWVSQNFARLVRASGVPVIRFHDLRHTHASLAVANGEPSKILSARLGHSDIGFTLRQYAHLMPEHHGLPADAVIGALFGGADDSCDQIRDQSGSRTAVSPSGEGL